MKRRLALAVLVCTSVPLRAAPTADEQSRIERLVASIASRTDLRFVRNGADYPAADAARFLREKFRARNAGIATAEEFVDRIATRSSTTGQPYLVRWPDGRQQPAAEFLGGELKRHVPARPQ